MHYFYRVDVFVWTDSSSLRLRVSTELKWAHTQANHILADLGHLENKVKLKMRKGETMHEKISD